MEELKNIKVALLGSGTVGTGVYKLIERQREELPHKVGAGLTVSKVLVRDKNKKREGIDPSVLTDQWEDIITDDEIQIVVEVMGGIEPARTYITEALQAGKNVVTANKDLMAVHGGELLDIASHNGCDLLFEASVAGGIPIIRPLKQCLAGNYNFIQSLTADEQQTLVLSSVLTTYQRGDFLYSCDDDCLGVLLVLSGKLRIFIQSGEQREITLFTTGPGEVCTLSASCAMQEISFDILIEAEEETKVLITPASTFRRLLNQNIYVENYIYRETTEHFSEVMWAMGQLLFTRLDQRLAGYLEDERIRTGSPVLSTTHEQIARNLGSAREVVSRTLKSFEKDGIVALSRGTVTILDVKKLRGICRMRR